MSDKFRKGLIMQKTYKKSSAVFLLSAAIIWGFAFVAQCDAAEKINMFLFGSLRFLLGGFTLLPIMFLFDRNKKNSTGTQGKIQPTVLYGAICGVILFCASTFQQWGINLSPNAGKAGFITGIYTVLVPIFSFIIFRKKTGINVWIGALCTVLGLYFLCFTNNGTGIVVSDIILFIGTIFWTFHIIVIDRAGPYIDPIKFSCIQFFICGILGMLAAAFSGVFNDGMALGQINDALFSILYAGICSSGIAYTLQVMGQKNTDPTYAAILLSCESVFAAIGGAIFGTDSEMGILGYLGCTVIFIGIVVSQITPKKKYFQKG